MKNFSLGLSMLGAALACLLSGQAVAGEEDMQVNTNAASICTGSREADVKSLQARALEVQNHGTTNAFVTCSFVNTTDLFDSTYGSPVHNVSYVYAFFQNKKATDQSVTCTLVQGFAGGAGNVYESQTATVKPAGTPDPNFEFGYVAFGPGEGDPLYYQNVSMTCTLPPGTSIADVYMGYKIVDNDGVAVN